MTPNRQKGLFLDRDGIINVDTGYVGHWADFVFQPGVFPFLRAATDKGYRLAIVTNQSGIGRGYYTAEDYEDLTAHMLAALAREGIDIPLVLHAPVHPTEGIGALRRDSFWRKPAPGMILEAAQRLGLDVGRSALLGDSPTDMEAALAAGVKRALWLTKTPSAMLKGVIQVGDFTEALSHL